MFILQYFQPATFALASTSIRISDKEPGMESQTGEDHGKNHGHTVDGSEILRHQTDGWHPINNGINHQLVQDFFHPQYHGNIIGLIMMI